MYYLYMPHVKSILEYMNGTLWYNAIKKFIKLMNAYTYVF